MRSSYIHIKSAELDHNKLDRSEPDHREPNQDLHRQIIMWDLLSCRTLSSIEWYFITGILEQLISPIFKGQEIQKREQSTTKVNWKSLSLPLLSLSPPSLSLSLLPSSNSLKTHDGLFFHFQAKKHQSWCTHHIELFLTTAHHRHSNMLRYAPENNSSPWAGTEKWQMEN